MITVFQSLHILRGLLCSYIWTAVLFSCPASNDRELHHYEPSGQFLLFKPSSHVHCSSVLMCAHAFGFAFEKGCACWAINAKICRCCAACMLAAVGSVSISCLSPIRTACMIIASTFSNACQDDLLLAFSSVLDQLQCWVNGFEWSC